MIAGVSAGDHQRRHRRLFFGGSTHCRHQGGAIVVYVFSQDKGRTEETRVGLLLTAKS